MTNSADLGGWYPPRPKAEVEKSSWLIYAPWREGCNHKRPYMPMLPTLYIKCKVSHLAILSTCTVGIFRVRPHISLGTHPYRSFSRDVIPFPVGHIGVPLSIA